jgi:hypothetical protein
MQLGKILVATCDPHATGKILVTTHMQPGKISVTTCVTHKQLEKSRLRPICKLGKSQL